MHKIANFSSRCRAFCWTRYSGLAWRCAGSHLRRELCTRLCCPAYPGARARALRLARVHVSAQLKVDPQIGGSECTASGCQHFLSCPLSTLFLAASNVFMLENQDSSYFLLALPSNLNGSQHTTSVEAWKLNSSNGIVVYSWPSWSSSLTTINIQHSFMAAQ